MAPKTISVEVLYAEGKSQVLVRLEMPVTATILEAITASTILCQFPHLAGVDALSGRVGIFGKNQYFRYGTKSGRSRGNLS